MFTALQSPAVPILGRRSSQAGRCRHPGRRGVWDHQERLDDARGINYASDGTVLGIELLSPRRRGVLLDGLPYPEDVARVMRAVGFRIPETAQ